MQLLIEQRVFSWSDTYDIYDEQGNQKYFVKKTYLIRTPPPCIRCGAQ